jgi:hypothetical protein
LATSLARRQRRPSAECGRGEPDGEATSSNNCSVVLRPIRTPVVGFVRGVDLRALGHQELPTGRRNIYTVRAPTRGPCTNAAHGSTPPVRGSVVSLRPGRVPHE